MAAIPFATFNRRRIRQVEFADEKPHHIRFGRLAQPLQHFSDMQMLRMFVRRYLVHTSQGNNTNKLSLRAFLTARLQWTETDARPVLQDIAAEELRLLVQVDKEIIERQERAAAANAGNQHAARADHPRGTRQGAPLTHQAENEFLFRTQVPSRTSYVSIAHIVFSVALLLYSASAFTSSERLVVQPFLRQVGLYVVVAGAAHLLAGITSGVHGLRMRIPLGKGVLLARAGAVLLAGALIGFALYVVLLMAVRFVNPDNQSLEEFYLNMVSTSPQDICQYQSKVGCAGFSRLCVTDASQCGRDCLSRGGTLCRDSLKTKVRDALSPIISILVIEAACVIVDVLLFLQLIRIAG
jgi:hypothetical protein